MTDQPFMKVRKVSTLNQHVSLLPGIVFIFAIAVLACFLIFSRASGYWPFNS